MDERRERETKRDMNEILFLGGEIVTNLVAQIASYIRLVLVVVVCHSEIKNGFRERERVMRVFVFALLLFASRAAFARAFAKGGTVERFTEEVLFVSPLPHPERRRRTRRNFTTSTNFAFEDDSDDESEKQPDGILFQSLFSWTMNNMNTNDLETFPRAIARLLQRDRVKQTSSLSKKDDEKQEKRKKRLMLEEFSVGFTRGRWRDAGAFGRKPMNFETSSALGMHVNGVFSREDDDDLDDGYDDDAYEKEKGEGWVRLTNTVGANFCAGANVRQRGLPRFYEVGGGMRTTMKKKNGLEFGSRKIASKNRSTTTTLFQSYPKEIACVENVASFFEMLPCGGRRGVANIIASERSVLIADVNFLSFGASYERGRFSLSMTGVASREGIEKMARERNDVKACAAAKEVSRVYALLGNGDARAVDLRESKKSSVAELLSSLKICATSTSSSSVKVDAPRVTITRAILGSGSIRGAISLSVSRFENARGDTVVRIFHPVPDYVRVFRHTFEVVSKKSSKGGDDSSSISNDSAVSDISWGKELLEMKIKLPRGLDSVTIRFDFEKIFLPLESFEADAERGMTFPPAIAFSAAAPGAESSSDRSDNDTLGRYERAYAKLGFAQSPLFEKLIENEKNDFAHFLDALTVILPVPDGAMPFNATAMACVAFVAHLGALAKILLKRENYDDKAKTLQHLAKVERKRLKSEEKKKAKSKAESELLYRRLRRPRKM
jgi:hypothetical protein